MPHWITLNATDEQQLKEWGTQITQDSAGILKVIGGSAL
jgi:hypothetical protein